MFLKHAHMSKPFPECANAHLQQYSISEFFRGRMPDPVFSGRKKGKGKTEEGENGSERVGERRRGKGSGEGRENWETGNRGSGEAKRRG